jgi:hypothetical protein
MLRLKGSALDRLPPEKRARMEKTLERMESIRRNDDMRVKDIVLAKRDWAEKEKQKGLDLIDQLEKRKEEVIKELTKRQDDIRQQLITVDGCLLALNDVLFEADRMEKAEKEQREAEAKRIAEEQAKKKIEEEKAKAEAEAKNKISSKRVKKSKN